MRRGWELKGVCFKGHMEMFRSERSSRSLDHVEKAPSIMGMRALVRKGGHGSFQLGPDQGWQGCEAWTYSWVQSIWKEPCQSPWCTGRCGAGKKWLQWELIILLRRSQSKRADKEQALHHMLKFSWRFPLLAKMECARYSLSLPLISTKILD